MHLGKCETWRLLPFIVPVSSHPNMSSRNCHKFAFPSQAVLGGSTLPKMEDVWFFTSKIWTLWSLTNGEHVSLSSFCSRWIICVTYKILTSNFNFFAGNHSPRLLRHKSGVDLAQERPDCRQHHGGEFSWTAHTVTSVYIQRPLLHRHVSSNIPPLDWNPTHILFSILFSQPQKEQLTVIYKTYLTLCLKSLPPKHGIGQSEAEVSKIVEALILVYEEVGKAYSRSKQSHYQFTSRHLTSWVFGMMCYELETEETSPLGNYIQLSVK